MQTTSLKFRQLAAGHVRPLAWGVRASFDKTFNGATTFFTLDSSILDGPDVLAPSDDNPIQEWDKYEYKDFSDRVISIEITREETEPYSVAQAYADITLNNYDNYFTPNSGSPIENNILPRRPFRALLGFGTEVLPQIVGLSEKMPTINKQNRAATFHVIDFMSYLRHQDIDQTIMLENVKTHEVLDYLFQYSGLLPTQYSLDDSLNTIKFFYVEKGEKFGNVTDKLMEAEIGRLFMDEAGIINFRNRYSYDLSPVATFNKSKVIDYSVSDESNIINSVKITGAYREVQPVQSIWTNATPIPLRAGSSADIFADFVDPVTSLVDPVYSEEEINTSYFNATEDIEGTVPYSDVAASVQLFSKSAKLTFTNTGVTDAFVMAIDIYGTPAKVLETFTVIEKDQVSIDKFEEQLYEINNPYIQDKSNAQSRALILLHDYPTYGGGVDFEVKGNPALQLGDTVELDLDGYTGLHTITKSTNILTAGKYTQRFRARKKVAVTFFVLDSSVLDGNDLLSP